MSVTLLSPPNEGCQYHGETRLLEHDGDRDEFHVQLLRRLR